MRSRGTSWAPRAQSGKWQLNAVAAERNFSEEAEFITLDNTSVHVMVMDDNTASVRLRTPDRTGLLNDITSAISNVGLMVESATVSTPSKEMVDNVFMVKVPGSAGVSFEIDQESSAEYEEAEDLSGESELELRLKAAVLMGVTTGVTGPPTIRVGSQGATAVEVTVTETGGKLVVMVSAADREGLLSLLSGTFKTLGMAVQSANITTMDGIVKNKFVLTGTFDDAEAIRQHTLEALRMGKEPVV
jgi:UTP:GlnB (protein PII) uridylyltransferase